MTAFAAMKEGGDFTPAPEGTYGARLLLAIDLGTQEDTYGSRRKLMVAFELTSKLMGDGRPYTVGCWYGATLNRKGKLRNDLASWLGRQLTPEEVKHFSWDLFAQTPCLVNVTHKVNENGDIRAKVQGITAVPEDLKVAPRSGELLILNLEDFSEEVFLNLPEGLAAIVQKSPEYRLATSKIEQAGSNNAAVLDAI